LTPLLRESAYRLKWLERSASQLAFETLFEIPRNGKRLAGQYLGKAVSWQSSIMIKK
jgi:hypothetical protein